MGQVNDIVNLVIGLMFLVLLCYLLEPFASKEEPCMIRAKFPLFGHLLGMLRHGNVYFLHLTRKRLPPIYTINLFRKKIYVVNSENLVPAIHRNHKTISFTPFVKRMAESLSGFKPHELSVFDRDDTREDHQEGLGAAMLSSFHAAFGPGAGSEDLQISMLNHLKSILDEIDSSRTHTVNLYAWVGHTISQATMRAIYGPKNPFADQAVEDAFWQFELTGGPLLMNFAPGFIARGAVKARTIVEKAFVKYYNDGGLDHASSLAWARFRPASEYGLSLEDSARLEVPLLFAALPTSVPVAFWTIGQICTRPDLLSDLRSELETVVIVKTSAQRVTFAVQIDRLKSKCPLLASIYQEVLRIHSCFSITRIVLEDTMIDGRYVLKKGGMVLIPSNVIHTSTSAWGPNAAETDFRRFMPKSSSGTRQAPHTFRSFGGPPNLCPGRHFASTEIMATIAIMLMRYDIEPRSGPWKMPREKQAVFAAVMPPAEDIEVLLKPREGWQGEWIFDLGDPTVKPALLCG